MKRLFTISVFLLLSFKIYSEPPSIQISNNSGCQVYFQLLTDSNAAFSCIFNVISPIITLAPGATVIYHTNSVPGLPPSLPKAFKGARIFSGLPACAPVTYNIGDPCLFGTTAAVYNGLDPTCQFCAVIKAAWTPSPCRVLFVI